MKFLKVLSLICVIPAICGCSVYMASQDSKADDVSIIEIGQTRAAVEEVLGRPVTFIRKWKGDEAEYIYFGPSVRHYGRATLYAVADVFTLGLAEFITTPVEHMQREQFRVQVLYDQLGRVKEYTHFSRGVPAGLPEATRQKMALQDS